MSSLTWASPAYFFALFLLPLLGVLFWLAEGKRRDLLGRLVAARLQSILVGNASARRRRLRFALYLAALGCLVVALARPQLGFTFEEAKRKGRDVLVAVDTSRSMLATDVAPSRLARTKLAVLDLLNTLEGDRLGLLAFAGSAFLQAPLTVDYQAVEASLQDLDMNIIPMGGTNIAAAIEGALRAFGKGESESRCLILFTDGDDLEEDAVEAAKKAAGTLRIFTVGVGSADGSLIAVPSPAGGTEFVRDEKGDFVKSRLDEARLKQIAEATGGFYVHLTNGPADMRRIMEEGLGKLKEKEIDERMSRKPIERYQWPLGLGLLLMTAGILLSERRGGAGSGTSKASGKTASVGTVAASVLVGLAFLFGGGQSANAAAAESPEELYKAGKYEEAKKAYEAALEKRPDVAGLRFNKGAAEYALGNYDAAVEEFSKALVGGDSKLRGKAEYNLGTALLQRSLKRDRSKEEEARKGDLTNAIQHFEEALKLDPKNVDAKENKMTAREELARPLPTPPPQQNQDKNDQTDDKKQENKDQQSKDQQSKDHQSKDHQSKDQQSKDQQSKDQQSKDQQGKDQQSKDQQGKDQQGQDQQGKDQRGNDQRGKDQQGKPSGTPAPPTEEKKLSGEIKAAESGEKGDKKPEPGAEDAAALEATGTNGEMSQGQARMLLDSLKSEDVQPFKNEQKGTERVLRDW